VSEVKTVTDMQYRGSVLIKPPVAAGQAKGATGAMLCKVHECLSPHVVADLERLRKRSRGRLMVGTNRYFFYVPHLAAMLQERTLFRVTLEMAGASVYPRRFMQVRYPLHYPAKLYTSRRCEPGKKCIAHIVLVVRAFNTLKIYRQFN
jgi:hypothetical protein